MDRRNMMMMAGIGLLASAIPMPKALAQPPTAQTTGYLFHDEFDGPRARRPTRRSG